METNKSEDKSIESSNDQGSTVFYHGTKADLKQGDLFEPGFNSNYGTRKQATFYKPARCVHEGVKSGV